MTDCPHGHHYPTKDAALTDAPDDSTAHACACGGGWLRGDPHRAAMRDYVVWLREWPRRLRTRRQP